MGIDIKKIIRLVHVLDSIGDDRLAPMTYKKLKEFGVTKEQRADWTQEYANEWLKNKIGTQKKNFREIKKTSANMKTYKIDGYSLETPTDLTKNLIEKWKSPVIENVVGSNAMIDNKVVYDGYEISKKVQDIYDKNRKAERAISKDMVGFAKNVGMGMEGLEFSVKSGSSTARKIYSKIMDEDKKETFPDGFTEEEKQLHVLNNMGDMVRYTFVSPHDKLVENTKKVVDLLGKRGYTIIEVDNKYVSSLNDPEKVNTYKGIHIGVMDKNGVLFEIQLHSPESLKVKEPSHALYEISRDIKKSKEKRDNALQECKKLWEQIENPTNIYKLENQGGEKAERIARIDKLRKRRGYYNA